MTGQPIAGMLEDTRRFLAEGGWNADKADRVRFTVDQLCAMVAALHGRLELALSACSQAADVVGDCMKIHGSVNFDTPEDNQLRDRWIALLAESQANMRTVVAGLAVRSPIGSTDGD